MSQTNAASWTCVDDFVEAYEASRELGSEASLLDFLPHQDHKLYHQVASELIRVDMECSWNGGHSKRLANYQDLLPRVFDDKEVVQQVAFEEYRLRLQSGEKVTAEAYGQQYGIGTANWPQWDQAENLKDDDSAQQESRNAELWQEATELVDDVQNFPAVGEDFLGFLLQQELGRGAFAHVFLARQGELSDRLVVIKVASGHSLEPQHLARLQHTNIVPIYSVHRRESLTAVCMPYFGARTLADLLESIRQHSGAIGSQQNLVSTFLNVCDDTQLMYESSSSEQTLPRVSNTSETTAIIKSNHVDAVVWLMKQLVEGIAHAHQRGIIHRDLKPANVLFTDEGLPMILDFNLSEDTVINGRASLLVGGTLPYMSPEHLEAVATGSKVGPQTDIYSLGVIFYELLTGKRPFSDHRGPFDDVVQKMIEDRKRECPSIIEANPSVSPAIASVVEKCLASSLKTRYNTADQLAEDLERHLRHQPLHFATDRSIAERGKKWLKRHPRLSSGGGVAAVASIFILATLALWFLRGERLARIDAEKTFEIFRQQQPSLYMALGAPHTEAEILNDSIDLTHDALNVYHVLDDNRWRNRRAYAALTKTDRKDLDHHLGELLYLLARANERLCSTEKIADTRSALIEDALELNNLATKMFSEASCPRGLLMQRVALLEMQGSVDAASSLRLHIKSKSTENVIDHYSQVYEYLDTQDYRAAKPLLVSLRDRNPTDPVPWLLLGSAHAALHDMDASEGCFTTAVALRPKSHLAFLQRGKCRLDKHKYDDALTDFEAVVALRPDLTCGYLNRALAYAALRNPEKALADLTKALDLGATQTRIYFLRAQQRRFLGDKDGAMQDFATGMKSTPSDELSWIARGIARLKMDPAAALSDFQQALRLNPISLSALRNSVHVFADRLNKPDQAMEVLNEILEIDEHDAQALAGRSVLLARQGKRQEAMTDVQHLLRVSKKPQVLFQAACAFSLTSSQQEQDLSKAMVLLSRAIQLEPSLLARAQTDSDLANLRKFDAYKKFVADYQKLNALSMNLNNTKVRATDGESE